MLVKDLTDNLRRIVNVDNCDDHEISDDCEVTSGDPLPAKLIAVCQQNYTNNKIIKVNISILSTNK